MCCFSIYVFALVCVFAVSVSVCIMFVCVCLWPFQIVREKLMGNYEVLLSILVRNYLRNYTFLRQKSQAQHILGTMDISRNKEKEVGIDGCLVP